jgi:hypothetical protein
LSLKPGFGPGLVYLLYHCGSGDFVARIEKDMIGNLVAMHGLHGFEKVVDEKTQLDGHIAGLESTRELPANPLLLRYSNLRGWWTWFLGNLSVKLWKDG